MDWGIRERIGWKREEGKNRRILYRTMQSWETRANAMAKQQQRHSIPELMEKIGDVHQDTATGPHKDFVSVEYEKRSETVQGCMRGANGKSRVAGMMKWWGATVTMEMLIACRVGQWS